VLPESYPNITFDGDGVCNYCVSFTPRNYPGKEALARQVNKRKGPSKKYDAVIGMSGGRDSSYAVYYAVRELGLKVLGYTFDNGFIPETTWENIHNAVSLLDIEHIVFSSKQVKDSVCGVMKGMIKKPSPAMVAFLCAGCDTGIHRGLDIITEQQDCRLVISGGGEPENTFAEYLLTGSSDRTRKKLVLGFIREIIINPYYLQPVLLVNFFREFLSRFRHRRTGYAKIDLFRYLEWDENLILHTIQGELNWRIPERMSSSWRSDCHVNVIRQFLYQRLLGFTKNNELLSQMIREKKITREQALIRLGSENSIDQSLLTEILNGINMPPDALAKALEK
jgi:hypothetical protein